MNTAIQRGTKKSAFEVVFGQKSNSFDSADINVNGIDSNNVNDIIEEGESIIYQYLPGNVNFSIYIANHLIDNDESGRESELNEDEPFTLTCPNRKKVGGEVRSNLTKNQEFKSKK